LYDADKAGTLSLHNRDGITGIDGSPVNCDRILRPADEKLMGGAKQDLYIVVENWNATSVTIRLIGTDEADASLTEDITVTGAGTYYATKLFKTLTQTQVTAFTGTSMDYELVQGQWGVVWKEEESYIMDCQLWIGLGGEGWFADEAVQVFFKNTALSQHWQSFLVVYGSGHLRLGRLLDATDKLTDRGVQLHFEYTTYIGNLIYKYSGADLELYLTSIVSGHSQNRLAIDVSDSNHPAKIYNCTLDTCHIYTIAGTNYDVSRLTLQSGQYGLYRCVGVFNDLLISKCSYLMQPVQGATSATIRNLVGKQNTYTAYIGTNMIADQYLVNPDLDGWNWYAWYASSTAKIYRQYEFDAHCQDKDGNDLSGVSVVGEYISPYGQAFSETTDVNGGIPTQTVDRSWYERVTGDTEQLKTPLKVTYSKAGYQTVVKYYDLEEKTKDAVVLHKAVAVFISLGTPVVNLKKTDPENKNVLVL